MSDDDTLIHTIGYAAEHLGTIIVKLSYVVVGEPSASAPSETAHLDIGPVHERCKKIGVHRVGYVNPCFRFSLLQALPRNSSTL